MKTSALLGLLFALTVSAQVPEARLAVLTGEVLGSAGTLLSGVKVSLGIDLEDLIAKGLPPPNWGGKSITSNSQGRFTIEGVPAGTYALSAEGSGYLRQPYGGKPGARSGTLIVVREGDRISNLVIRMSQPSV